MRRRSAIIIPDSEDDVQSSSTSIKNYSTLRQPVSLRQGGSSLPRSRATRVIPDYEDEADDDFDRSSKVSTRTRTRASGTLEVVIPAKQDETSTDSSRSSLGITSADGATGSNTPATSVGAAAESDIKKPRRRVNASERVARLQSNTVTRRTSLRGTKRSAATMEQDQETTDEALARALQIEEYEKPRPKKQRNGFEDLQDSARSLAERLDAMPPDTELSESELSDRITPVDTEEEAVFQPSASDSEKELFSAAEERENPRLRLAFPPEIYADEDEDLPSWEEQRKIRRMQADRKKLEKKHPIILTMWDDLKARPLIPAKEAQQPESITRKLKPFQLEGLNWMMEQEKTDYRGGLLGDEMGMGKTIQAVSLIMSDFPQPNPTLVLVPPVALMQWVSEIKEYTDGKLKVLVYHNSDSKVKKLTQADIRKYDVIMISYSSLESIYRKQEKGWTRGNGTVKEDSIIHSIDYHRLILDEAHSIKQRTTGVAKACFALKASFKWCLSGTPVQNRIGEFFSLLRFLQVRPFASYFCKQCPCSQLQWTANKQGRCTECSHTGFNHISIFNKEILNPITEGRTQEERKLGLSKLRLITDHIMLRRLKQEHTSSMELPPKRITIHNEFFGEIEHDFSRSIMTNSSRQFDTYVSRGVMLNNYANIFGLIMQMRQVANHPDLILKKHVQPGFNVLVCRVCDEPAEDAIRSRCHHEFCRKCAKDYIQSFEDGSTVDCPQCHIPLSIDLEQPTIEQSEESVKKNSIINRIFMEDWTSSTKIETLLYELYLQRSKSHTPKSIIFSQFTSMLQLVEWRLRHAGFNTVMLDGTMTPAQRQKSIEHFMTNADVEVFLVSLKAGGVALNLTEASRVFIVDPWWNPAAEWQSADRSHRIGQQRPCVITRLTIEDSVESRIVQLQEKKANLIRGTINKDQGDALEKLTPEDMQFLFRGS
ncbi:DNA repair protein RAD16 [Penicillium atrosanguineum]|uniref:DNA repair protein RAD16 n=1 Tax=Penicillium atrosanguineum TaxID=1132637 RepID=A0A9W9PXF8_9EURO|nr:DNA repair protein RAD16 [Penicillium atrosanguineum]KAJ5140556.1 DNA repair protein RAD16 [Penicillium atrosanguineum]KAJ5315990.1 DNA repair protein RAD16 [Penicillium atrosanguineum]